MAVIMSKTFTLPSVSLKGTLLSDLTEGSVVLIQENDIKAEFYIAKHDYESSLNGAGRTLLVRKDCYDLRQWSSSDVSYFGSSTIKTWLNDTYKSLLPESVQEAIGSTVFKATSSDRSSVTTMSLPVFLLSVTEMGLSGSYALPEGTALPIASTLLIAEYDGSATSQWLRTPRNMNSYYAYYITASGAVTNGDQYGYNRGSRPVFTLPSNALFNPDTKEFVGVGG